MTRMAARFIKTQVQHTVNPQPSSVIRAIRGYVSSSIEITVLSIR
jgi:hypothetical protein